MTKTPRNPISLPSGAVAQYEKTNFFEEGGRRLSGKDLER
jgi:hypothetical protein